MPHAHRQGVGTPTTPFTRPSDEESLRALRATIELAPVGIAHFARDGRFLLVNDQLCATLGRTRAELLASTFQEITFPDDLPTCVALTARLAAAEIPSYRHEKRFVRQDGSTVWVRVSVSCVRDPDGRPEFFLGVAEDVTEQRVHETALRAEEARFRTLANAIPQMAWIADAEGRRSWFNERWYEFTGLDLAASRDFGWTQVHHPDHLERVRAEQRDAFDRGAVWEDTFPLRRHDGEYRWFLSRAMPLRDDDGGGDAVRWFGTNTDITERLEAERERERVSRVRDELLAVVAHDLRNPVHTIMMSAATMLELPLDEEQRARQLGVVQRAARGMNTLIDDLLDVTRIEAGTFAIRQGRVHVGALLDETLELFDPHARARDVSLGCDVPPDVPPMLGDRDRLAQLLSNLIGNALKFTPRGGEIRLRARHAGDHVEVSVEDSGMGIPAESLPHVFDRFWQADRRAQGGAGLGLAIVKGIVEAHGGAVAVESEPGRGTTFRCTIPCAGA